MKFLKLCRCSIDLTIEKSCNQWENWIKSTKSSDQNESIKREKKDEKNVGINLKDLSQLKTKLKLVSYVCSNESL